MVHMREPLTVEKHPDLQYYGDMEPEESPEDIRDQPFLKTMETEGAGDRKLERIVRQTLQRSEESVCEIAGKTGLNTAFVAAFRDNRIRHAVPRRRLVRLAAHFNIPVD